mgnify:CR=1 FL=1
MALPDDVHLLERLNSGMSHLITDGDADVCQAARKVRSGGVVFAKVGEGRRWGRQRPVGVTSAAAVAWGLWLRLVHRP